MFPFQIDQASSMKKWQPLVETLGLDTTKPLGRDKLAWMSEYAEMHQMREFLTNGKINENVAFVGMNSITGMGPVVSPQPGSVPGTQGTTGSGDLGQNLLPVSMKIAYQTIGLDLVAVKPSSGPKIDLLYMDYRYDDSSLEGGKEKPQLFQLPVHTDLKTHLDAIINNNTNTSGRMFVKIVIGKADSTIAVHNPQQEGGLAGAKSEYIVAAEVNSSSLSQLSEYTAFYLEFIGYSRYNGNAIFRAYRQTNNASSSNWAFDHDKNSFPYKMSIAEALGVYAFTSWTNAATKIAYLAPSFTTGAGSTATPIVEGAGTGVIWATGTYRTQIDLVSTLEDQVEGFSANWNKNYPMNRLEEEDFNPGVIGANFFTKTIQTGTIEISAAVKRNEIEDIKATTGIDIVAKLEGILINELSQTISKNIVSQIKELAMKNRTFAPKIAVSANAKWGGYETLFDFDVDKYMSNTFGGVSNYRENSASLQRKLVSKIRNASAFIYKEGRYGSATYIVTSGNIAGILTDNSGHMLNPYTSAIDTQGQLYPAGTLGNITVYVDPYQDFMDNTIFLGRKNNPDQPGLIFIPYLMAQTLSIISENTRAPRIFLRSRYAVAPIGFYPEKQFMAMNIRDTFNVLM